jgi:signal transduction histidine kinase/DNA-binding response OmpR family regulator
MPVPHLHLSEFVKRVPVCPDTAAVAVALASLQQANSEDLVLVNDRHAPVGLVRHARLLSCLLAIDRLPGLDVVQMGGWHPQTAVNALEPSLIEPLMLLAANSTIEQFLPELPLLQQACCALVNPQGQFVGLLDSTRLLIYVTQQWMQQRQTTTPPRSPANKNSKAAASSARTQQRKLTQLTQQVMAQKAELERQLREQREQCARLQTQQQVVTAIAGLNVPALVPPSGALTWSTVTPLAPLVELLDRLPLPLMLQTSGGQVLTQNLAWQQQMGELLDPNWVRQEAAALLELPPPAAATLLSALPSGTTEADLLAESSPAVAKAIEQHLSATPTVCHLGPKPNTCICTCSLKNGQEQVLQFVKIPIGTLAPQPAPASPAPVAVETANNPLPNLGILPLDPSLVRSLTLPPFRLAALMLDAAAATMEAGHSTAIQADQAGTETIAAETLWLILAQDITQQQQLERELTAKNADLIQLNRLKDEFLACISHELRTPLTAVLGLSSLLKDQTLGALNQRQVHYAQLIYQSGRHLMAVVNDILDLTRMETGQLDLAPEPVEIAAVCHRALEQAKQLRLLDDKRLPEQGQPSPDVVLEIEAGLDLIVADELRLRQMLLHLLSNAFKFTEPDRPIGLKVSRWGGWIAFTVWDTGIGIPAEKQHLIFQKFQQLENPLTRRYEGTGLGLVLTQRLARLHGGDVTFISKEGQGSQFTILLPPSPPGKPTLSQLDRDRSGKLSQEYPAGRVPLHTPASPVGDLTSVTASRSRLVLIVEAAPQFIETLSDQLSRLGHCVVIARSGTEALEKARRLQPCLIFLNPVLPLLSGWDVLTLLKSKPETRQIPVVITSTQVDEEQAHRCQADGLLSLPVQAKALRQVVRRLVLETQAPESPPRPANVLTVLRLSPGLWSASASVTAETALLNHLLHSRYYRILEADDLEQAELLARVWKPNVVLFDGKPLNADDYFQQFSQHTFLASLPLVTLDVEATEAANQVLGLLVFPCLITSEARRSPDADPASAALLQVIQVAAGYAWRPTILAIDAAMLPLSVETSQTEPSATQTERQETKWLQALMQYLQTAGLRGSVGRSWQEVLQQVQSQTVDLLLLCWTDAMPTETTLQILADLQALEPKPPLLVLDHRQSSQDEPLDAIDPLPDRLQQLATQILPLSLPMPQLLEQIHAAMHPDRTATTGAKPINLSQEVFD